MKNVTFIIQVFLDCDYMFLPGILNAKWVKERMEFFNTYTLNSILNLDFQDFRLFLLCGKEFRAITESFAWDPKVELVYDLGKKLYLEEIETEYISITRIDSDDLFHSTAMTEVVNNQLLTDKRECLIFRRNLRWDMVNGYIGTHHRRAGPFYTHIFPKQYYKYWKMFKSLHFQTHGRAGGKLIGTVELPPYKVCVVKHNQNHSMIKVNDAPKIRPPIDFEMLTQQEFAIFDKERMVKKLKEYGVKREVMFHGLERKTRKHIKRFQFS